jgi:hypothetical protein
VSAKNILAPLIHETVFVEKLMFHCYHYFRKFDAAAGDV